MPSRTEDGGFTVWHEDRFDDPASFRVEAGQERQGHPGREILTSNVDGMWTTVA